MRINIFENFPVIHRVTGLTTNVNANAGTLNIHQVYIPGSLSFNNIAFIISARSSTAQSFSLSFGLFSLNGSTLSLANSASASTSFSSNQTTRQWFTLATSATQDITPGNWYLGHIVSSSGTNQVPYLKNEDFNILNAVYGGPFLWGILSISTGAIPASIATSDLTKALDDSSNNIIPYILISA